MSDKDLQTTNNLTIDYGHFLIQDTSHLTTPSNPDLTETTIVNHAKNNYIQFTKGLFEMLKSQQGQDDAPATPSVTLIRQDHPALHS